MSGSLVPTLRYDDASAAITLLTEGFGFTVRARHEGPTGRVVHAELVHGTGMVMLGSTPLPGEDRLEMDLGAASTYVILPADADVDAHAGRAVVAGAILVRPPTDEDYGGRGYTCRDLEGHWWSFGTYDPWGPLG